MDYTNSGAESKNNIRSEKKWGLHSCHIAQISVLSSIRVMSWKLTTSTGPMNFYSVCGFQALTVIYATYAYCSLDWSRLYVLAGLVAHIAVLSLAEDTLELVLSPEFWAGECFMWVSQGRCRRGHLTYLVTLCLHFHLGTKKKTNRVSKGIGVGIK